MHKIEFHSIPKVIENFPSIALERSDTIIYTIKHKIISAIREIAAPYSEPHRESDYWDDLMVIMDECPNHISKLEPVLTLIRAKERLTDTQSSMFFAHQVHLFHDDDIWHTFLRTRFGDRLRRTFMESYENKPMRVKLLDLPANERADIVRYQMEVLDLIFGIVKERKSGSYYYELPNIEITADGYVRFFDALNPFEKCEKSDFFPTVNGFNQMQGSELWERFRRCTYWKSGNYSNDDFATRKEQKALGRSFIYGWIDYKREEYDEE